MSYSADKLFRFEETEGGYALAEYLQKENRITEVEIPAEYNGLPVAEIGEMAFSYTYRLSGVTLPDTITRLGESAFKESWLESVNIPNSVTELPYRLFFGCWQLSCINIPEGVVHIEKEAFFRSGIRSVTLPKSLEFIGDEAFSECKDLESVTFNSKPKFGERVFFDCPELPADVTLMGLVRSCDITRPIAEYVFRDMRDPTMDLVTFDTCVRPDVMELAAKNDCYRNVDGDFLEMLLHNSIKAETPETTAYLLELKRRKFGFDNGGEFEL